MSIDFYKRFHGISGDPKLRRIAKKTGAHICFVISFWGEVLEHASKNNPRGRLDGFDLETTALNIDLEVDLARKIFEEMGVGEAPLHRNGEVTKFVTKHNGNSNGPRNAMSNAERQAKFRKAQKDKKKNESVTERNEGVTLRNARARASDSDLKKVSKNSPYPSVDNSSGEEEVFENEKIGNGEVEKEAEGFDILRHLDQLEVAVAKGEVDGWDFPLLVGIFNENVRTGKFEIPRKPLSAFCAWLKSYTKGKPP